MSRDKFQDRLAQPPPRQSCLDVEDDTPISVPPPIPTSGLQRLRTAVELPPLSAWTPSSSPTRASTFLPFLRPQSTRTVSPERVSVAETAESSVSAELSVTKRRPTGAVERLASWFEGSSEPVNITLVPSPRKEKTDPLVETETMDAIFSAGHSSKDNFTRRSQERPTNASTSRFSFFRKSTVSLPHETLGEDELVNMNVEQALYPHGRPDEYSPAAFKNLEQNAEGTIRRFQHAYTEQQLSLKQITSAKNVQSDELDAAQTRNEHLKMQLQEMAERATEQERMIARLRAELAAQRSSLDTFTSRQQSVRMVSDDGPSEAESTPRSRYRRQRSSDVSTSGESELGSDVSSVVSVFSEPLSPASSKTTSAASPVSKVSMMSAREDCPNCHGMHTSEAWDVINVMRAESTALKQRVAQLESAQDDALDFLSGLKLA
ncbi:hypothetical protein PV08_00318 [Exophiala spinifera]|uniref:Uncharacterized protein n=1 Tax=Exophiala spinifera TaxID=91928 RepID=A0A0D2C840_9EURO|nr:uncharacterized protein PV08_00318 [Exophiala spinifera]KIW19744.1 hypothetical protein PV08_00318 [Exophiala spinifera]